MPRLRMFLCLIKKRIDMQFTAPILEHTCIDPRFTSLRRARKKLTCAFRKMVILNTAKYEHKRCLERSLMLSKD